MDTKRKECMEMGFDGIKLMNVDLLGLSQIYLNQNKIKIGRAHV